LQQAVGIGATAGGQAQVGGGGFGGMALEPVGPAVATPAAAAGQPAALPTQPRRDLECARRRASQVSGFVSAAGRPCRPADGRSVAALPRSLIHGKRQARNLLPDLLVIKALAGFDGTLV